MADALTAALQAIQARRGLLPCAGLLLLDLFWGSSFLPTSSRLRRILPDYAGTTHEEKAEGSCSTTDCSTGVLFLHETVTLIMLGGAVIILGGVLLTSFPRSRPA